MTNVCTEISKEEFILLTAIAGWKINEETNLYQHLESDSAYAFYLGKVHVWAYGESVRTVSYALAFMLLENTLNPPQETRKLTK